MHVHVRVEVGCSTHRFKFWDHYIISLEVLYFIIKVGDHECVCLIVLRVFCPNIRQIFGEWNGTVLAMVLKISWYTFSIPVSECHE